MFKNIGRKIMVVAEISCYLGIVFSIAAGMLIFALGIISFSTPLLFVYGLLILLLGPLFSWLSTMPLYGFGRLIENSDIIAEREED